MPGTDAGSVIAAVGHILVVVAAVFVLEHPEHNPVKVRMAKQAQALDIYRCPSRPLCDMPAEV
jgi:hypothetical protein